MLTMDQLEELESRIIKALDLIGDLRTENGRLESENETYRRENDELKLAINQKEKELAAINSELQKTSGELANLKQKEEALERKILEMLSRLDKMGAGAADRPSQAAAPQGTAAVSAPSVDSTPVNVAAFAAVASVATEAVEAAERTVTAASGATDELIHLDDDDELIIIEDAIPSEAPSAAPMASSGVAAAAVGVVAAAGAAVAATHAVGAAATSDTEAARSAIDYDEEIVLIEDDEPLLPASSASALVEDDDIVIIEDDEPEIVMAPASATPAKPATPQALDGDIIIEDEDDELGIFDTEDEDDFLIVEEEAGAK